MELTAAGLRHDSNLRIFRTAAYSGLQEQAVPLNISDPALLPPA